MCFKVLRSNFIMYFNFEVSFQYLFQFEVMVCYVSRVKVIVWCVSHLEVMVRSIFCFRGHCSVYISVLGQV